MLTGATVRRVCGALAALFPALPAAAQGPYFRPFVSYTVSTYSFEVVTADFDGDGALDLATPNWHTDDVSILLGNGDGTFLPAVHYPAGGGSPINLEVGYFNGDTAPDLVVVNRGPGGSCSSFVSILLNNGDGTFQAPVTYPIGSCPWEITVDHLDGDAHADLAVVNTGEDTVSILLGNGDGTFQPAAYYAASGNSYAVAAGDYNGDGARDLAVSNLFGPLSILLGNGDGTFQPQVTYPAGAGGHRIAMGFFNADSRPDLAVFNIFSNDVSILLGNGDGTFQLPIPHALVSTPVGNTLADFNGDGKVDIAVTGYQTDKFSLLLGNGDGTFHSGGDFCVVAFPYGIRAGDYNGDGRADVATSSEEGIVSVRLATPVASPACGTAPPPILAFGLLHEPLNGANLSFDGDGNLVVTSGGGPGGGDEDVSVHVVGDNSAGLACELGPETNFTQPGQRLKTTVRGQVGGVPDTLVSTSTIEGTGTSALLTVNFAIGGTAGQRARLYDGQNRLIDCMIVPNASPFTLTPRSRGATITKSTSNVKNNLTEPRPEHEVDFSTEMEVTNPTFPGVTWPDVRKIAIETPQRQSDSIRNVNVTLGKKPAGSSLVIKQEGPQLAVWPTSSASFSTTGAAVITPVLGTSVLLTEPPDSQPAKFAIADRGVPGELRRGKKLAVVGLDEIAVGPLAEGAYLKTTANLLVKNKLCPPECYPVSVTQTKVPGPLPVAISADFTALGSTTHRVTVKLDGVVLGVHEGVGPALVVSQDYFDFIVASQAEPITRSAGDPVKGVGVGVIKKPQPPLVVQISGVPYTADEIIIEPEYPTLTVEAIDQVQLETQGLGSVTVNRAVFEDVALLVGGIPVTPAGPEAQIDLDTHDQLAVYHIGGTGQDGYRADLSVGPPGYATRVPRLPAGGTSEGRYDFDIGTGTVSLKITPAGGGDDLAFEPITPSGTYDLSLYKKGLKVSSASGLTGVAMVLTGGTKPIPVEMYIEEVEGMTYVVQEFTVGGDIGTAVAGCCIGGTGNDGVRIACPVPPGSTLRQVDYRVATDRPDAVLKTDHALLELGRMPIAGLGEAEFEAKDGGFAATGLTDSGRDGAGYKAIKEQGIQVADMDWLPPAAAAETGSSITTTGSFASAVDPTTRFPAKKKDKKRPDGRFDVTADFTALGSSTVRVGVLSGGVVVADLPGHAPDVGVAATAPTGAAAGSIWYVWSGDACVGSSYPPSTEFVIDGQTYTGDQLVIGSEGRAATDLLMGLDVTTVGYERLVFEGFSFEPIPPCLADLNDDTLVDFLDYLEFLNFYDAQDPHVDFNQDGLVDFGDYLEFLNLYDAGC